MIIMIFDATWDTWGQSWGKEIDFKKGLADALQKLAAAHLAKGHLGILELGRWDGKFGAWSEKISPLVNVNAC